MVIYKNDCCDCAVPAYPCLGNVCPLRHNPHYYCDICGEETDNYHQADGMDLCDKCYRKEFTDEDESD